MAGVGFFTRSLPHYNISCGYGIVDDLVFSDSEDDSNDVNNVVESYQEIVDKKLEHYRCVGCGKHLTNSGRCNGCDVG